MLPHATKEGLEVVYRGGPDQLTIIEPQTNPKVVHEDREASHDGHDAPWATKFVALTLQLTIVLRRARSVLTGHACQAVRLPSCLGLW